MGRALHAMQESPLARHPRWLSWLAVAAVGCASYQGSAHAVATASLANDPGWTRIEHLPVTRQAGAKDCGAAALSSVLNYWERAPNPADDREVIDRTLRQSPSEGLTAGALRDYARKLGFQAYVFNGTLADLRHEVAAGRPVIVGVHKPLSDKSWLTHYEVFIGIQPLKAQVLTFDPAHGLRENTVAAFLEEWKRSGQVTLVVLPSPDRT